VFYRAHARPLLVFFTRPPNPRQFELLITLQHHPNATTPGHAVLRAVIS
jgi:hypothetical protein